MPNYDFCGYATRANVRCADGRTILRDAFKGQDGETVPIVWQHQRNDPENVLGHGILENRDDGVFVYGSLNDSPKASRVKALLEHGDISALSIYAIDLVENRKQVSHGLIKEVSIVIAGANPEARIDNVCIQHGEDIDILADQAMIVSGEDWDMLDEDDPAFEHAAEDDSSDDDGEASKDSGKTARDVFNTLNDEQKQLFYAVVAHVADNMPDDDSDEDDDGKATEKKPATAQHSADNNNNEGGTSDMAGIKYNAFEGSTKEPEIKALDHSVVEEVFKSAQKVGSLKAAYNDVMEAHGIEHGIENIDILFPEAKAVTATPDMIMRQQEWVAKVWNATSKSPFSRIKTMTADITKDEARARGYLKGHKKVEEAFSVMKRTTTPQTIYKLQKLDRDDIIDITDFDVVAWVKAEMRLMLNEELSRAVLVGDGRQKGTDDKIGEDHIRPVFKDDELYCIHKLVDIKGEETREQRADKYLDAIYEARNDYRGSGSPVLYTTSGFVTDMLLARDQIGRRLYNTVAELASALRVREIVEVPVMDGVFRETPAESEGLPTGYKTSSKYDLLGIIVNLTDYRVGADRGGAVTLFDDFDLNYNKYEYLLETRCSGALIRPKSAIALEKAHSGE